MTEHTVTPRPVPVVSPHPVPVISPSPMCMRLVEALGFTEDDRLVDLDIRIHLDEVVTMTARQQVNENMVERVLELLTDGSWREQGEENDERD